jgi:hypothetical protein
MFTHLRASIDTPSWYDHLFSAPPCLALTPLCSRIDKILGFRFPPYTTSKMDKLNSRLNVKLPARPTGPPAVASNGGVRKWFLLAFAMAFVGALTKMKNRLPFIKT